MTIEQAIAEAKANNIWNMDKPTSVNVGFYNYADERDDETQFDIDPWRPGSDPEYDLIELWHDQWEEMGSKLTGVLYVETLGEYDDCMMEKSKYEKVKEKIQRLLSENVSRTKVCAYIHDLYQEYMISANQEDELYVLADPDGEADNTFLDYYYHEMEEENPLFKITD